MSLDTFDFGRSQEGMEPCLEPTPPVYGRCPVCDKPLYPRSRHTGEFKAPLVGSGYESRARCLGCGTILCYSGAGRWRVLTNDDLTPEELRAGVVCSDVTGRH